MIVKANGDMIQVTRICDSFAGLKKIDESLELQNDEECDKTLEQLPSKQSFFIEKELEYMYLTGPTKNKK